jgi:HAMP domain-containing protein
MISTPDNSEAGGRCAPALGSEALWQNRLAEAQRELKRLEARIDAEKMSGKIVTDNLARLLNEVEAAVPRLLKELEGAIDELPPNDQREPRGPAATDARTCN